MSLPPFPEGYLPASPREKLLLVQWGEQCRAMGLAEAARDADEWGGALNAAGWEATEAYRRHTGQVEPVLFFNFAKSILRDAFAVYFAAVASASVSNAKQSTRGETQ